nr:unnamed protein product [Digitaria exilis]
MRPPTARLLAAGALAAAMVALGCLAVGAGATVVTTCRAAADSDTRVDYRFCVAQLGNHHNSPDADIWGLAKVAALTGIINADNAVYDAKKMLVTARPKRAALEQCSKLYDSMGYAFAKAVGELNYRPVLNFEQVSSHSFSKCFDFR